MRRSMKREMVRTSWWSTSTESLDWRASPEFHACIEDEIDWMGKNLDEAAVMERRILLGINHLDRKYH